MKISSPRAAAYTGNHTKSLGIQFILISIGNDARLFLFGLERRSRSRELTYKLTKTYLYLNNQLSNMILMLMEIYLILEDTNLKCCFINILTFTTLNSLFA